VPVRVALRPPEPAPHVTETPQGHEFPRRSAGCPPDYPNSSQHEAQGGCTMPPLALQPEFRPKPQDTPTRLLAREASELRQTEFIP
jgi:hypothetical protein